MFRVVGKVVAGAGMGKDDQPVSIKRDPRQEFRELCRAGAELAGKHRVRTYGAFVHSAHRDTKLIPRSFAEVAGLLGGISVKIDVNVVVGDDVCVFHTQEVTQSGQRRMAACEQQLFFCEHQPESP